MKRLTVVFAAIAAAAIGCDMNKIDPGGGASSPSVVSLRGEPVVPDAVDDPDDGDGVDVVKGPPGTLTGRVVLEGAGPTLAALVAKGTSKVDPTVCAKDGAIPDQSFVVSPDGGIANVFIYLAKSPKPPEGGFELPEKQTVLDQAGCVFTPHALIWRAGAPVELKNGDNATHNIQLLTSRNDPSNDNMPPGSNAIKTFAKTEKAPFKATCAIHGWMEFRALVVDHPYAAVTDKDGRFEISNLPAGEHSFRVWHEKVPGKTGMLESKWKVVVKPGPDVTTEELKYAASKFDL
jgi:plastocyanin